jgi:hypothetical protein
MQTRATVKAISWATGFAVVIIIAGLALVIGPPLLLLRLAWAAYRRAAEA